MALLSGENDREFVSKALRRHAFVRFPIENRKTITEINDRVRQVYEIKTVLYLKLVLELITVIIQPHLADLTHIHVLISGANAGI